MVPLITWFEWRRWSNTCIIKIHQNLCRGGILGSALGMDKILMKKIFSHLTIPQVNYLAIQNQNISDDNVKNDISIKIIEKLNLPVFVKPANSGSSLGISKAKNKSEIINALQKAWEIDSRIVVEEGLDVRELECGIIGKIKLSTSEIGEVYTLQIGMIMIQNILG